MHRDIMGNRGSKDDTATPVSTTIDTSEDQAFGKHDFPFENLVMEGGGVRGVAHIGALMVLESAGILKNITRVAGTSSGAIFATLVALKLTCKQMAEELDIDIKKMVFTGGIKKLGKPFMFFQRLGWDTGEGFYEYCGSVLERHTRTENQPGNPDITFQELYERTKIELCIVVTNLNQQREVYFHVKTAADLPIRKALRMSMSLPALFQPVVEDYFGVKEYFVDGGMACNYPLHCFDGWWLSMKEEDSFFKKLVLGLADLNKALERSERFEPVNPKTIGIMLYSDDDIELFEQEFWNRLTPEEREYDRPTTDTEAAREYYKKKEKKKKEINRKEIREYVNRFLTALKNKKINPDSPIDRKELDSYFVEDGTMTDAERRDFVRQLFDQMDADKNGQLTYTEIEQSFGKNLVQWLLTHVGWSEEPHDKRWRMVDYLKKYLDLFFVRNKKFFHQAEDVHRTIGVDTKYVKVTSFDLEDEDKMFLYKVC
ncbi:PREDICTED: uncharacterized protein LOC109486630 [Branchiostoma belcheri]|uniref:Uncharacterized protein LOC109486630 n=1 Tax=Branchiostoma belcheri TaxID=7741 RepID=A0A6P5ASI8_BRABE|nr:PREDICTED: uncharacterized protein LOC109486630 [Branchiostoma belcheri]